MEEKANTNGKTERENTHVCAHICYVTQHAIQHILWLERKKKEIFFYSASRFEHIC